MNLLAVLFLGYIAIALICFFVVINWNRLDPKNLKKFFVFIMVICLFISIYAIENDIADLSKKIELKR